MKTHCDVIKDLLPLYMEEMASQESVKLVEEHLSDCPACAKELEEMKAVPVIPVETETQTLRHIKKSILKRRLLTAFTAVMVVISAYLGFAEFMNADIWVPAEAAIERVELDPEGNLRIYTDHYVNGSGATWDYNGNHTAFMASMRMKNYLFPKDTDPTWPESVHTIGIPNADTKEMLMDISQMGMDGEDLSSYHFWYVNIPDGTAGMPLWGTDRVEPPEGPIIAVSYFLFSYCGGLLLMAVVLGILSLWMKGKAKTAVQVICALCLSLCVGTVLTCGGQLVSYFDDAPWKIRDSLLVALPLFVTLLCARKLCLWMQADKIA